MPSVTIAGTVHELECNALTPFVYSEEFMTQGSNGKTRGEDINACAARITDVLQVDGVPPMLDLLRLFWAFEKTANPRIKRFKAWLRELPKDVLALDAEDEGSWAFVVMGMFNETFFPSTASADVVPADE